MIGLNFKKYICFLPICLVRSRKICLALEIYVVVSYLSCEVEKYLLSSETHICLLQICLVRMRSICLAFEIIFVCLRFVL